MWTENYRWHYDYVRLAWDTGFSFEKYKNPNLDKNKICLVDVDRITRERDVASVERHIPVVLQYILESDQAEVLDTNFVKMFRISQLSVEYLLFCKMYLDNTAVLLKKELSKLKEENKELKLFSGELENHISALTQHNNSILTFKCEKCDKVFSTEEYLKSHIKRRHSDESTESTARETDKLQSEIKQLKERLNVAEKLLQDRDEKTENANSVSNVDENKIKVNEIQEKFERFREKVENDIKILQIEKNFYEDKYSKLFDVVLVTNNKENVNTNTNQHLEPARKEPDKNAGEKISVRMENTTQTEKGSNIRAKELQIETVHNKNVYNFKHISSSSESISEKKVDIKQEIEEKISKFEENVELKITSSLHNIESQMQAFWGKLSELELKREENLTVEAGQKEYQNNPVQFVEVAVRDPKPVIKPRTKFSKPTRLRDDHDRADADRIKNELEKMYTQSQPKPLYVDTVKNVPKEEPKIKILKSRSSVIFDTSPSSESESDTRSSKTKVLPSVLPDESYESKPSMSTLGKRSNTSLKKAAQSKEVLEKFREEISNIINNRLQEIGISPNWKGIPQKTYEKALEIVNHQASLTKRTYTNFDSIKRSIEKSLKIQTDEEKSKKISKAISPSRQQPNMINISYRRKSNVTSNSGSKSERTASTVTIKNRSLYDTDTESESLRNKAPARNTEIVPPYSAVIEEIKSSRTIKIDADSDSNSIVLPNEDNRSEPQTKSALRNYPSVGSLTKKKVLFDIETEESKLDDDPSLQAVGGGTTTNVGSSVLDESQDVSHNKESQKKDESISDFDFSEL